MTSKLFNTIRLLTLCAAVAVITVASPRSEERFARAKLQFFIESAVAVSKVADRWTPRIRGAENNQQAAALTKQSHVEIAGAIDATEGITLEEYREIGAAARKDRALLDRMSQIFKTKTKKN